ncbi:HD domain-containing protein [Nonomuraea sp. bgisy101]|uniref:HD domain-containing protein n=1 Tax=Nonomuraea sp. bgisy101 TaxID=3413784 RepID=UPI003D728E72
MNARASFHAMTDSTAADYEIIVSETIEHMAGLPERILAHLRLLSGDHGGFAVDRLTHCLQAATRAQRAGKDDEYVLCALIHDIGDTLGSFNHADVTAAVLKPFVSERNHWMVANHDVFQGRYFFHHLGLDPELRERFRGHEHFEHTVEFCHEFDQTSFDPGYDTLPLEHFAPLVRELMNQPRRSLYLGSG